MANEIYLKSWWGQPYNLNNIYWGSIYEDYILPLLSSLYLTYIQRVPTDGGTLEDSECLKTNTRNF